MLTLFRSCGPPPSWTSFKLPAGCTFFHFCLLICLQHRVQRSVREGLPEAEFLDVIGAKSLKSFPPCYSQSPLLILHSSPWRKSGLKLVCNVNIVYGNLMSENSQYYAQKPQGNSTFMNSPSAVVSRESGPASAVPSSEFDFIV